MKNLFFVFVALLSLTGTAKAKDVSQENANIESCTKKTNAFLKDVRFENRYYTGRNEHGKCFIRAFIQPNFSAMNLFINSLASKYVASVEISKFRAVSATGITSVINRCDADARSLNIESTYRMPRFLSYGNDGSIPRPASIFDRVDNQSIQLRKNKAGDLIAATITTANAGTLNCYFRPSR